MDNSLKSNNLDVYFCVTPYHLLLSLLFINSSGAKSQSVLLLNAHSLSVYNIFSTIAPRLRSNGYIVQCHLRNKIKDVFFLEKKIYIKQYEFIEKVFKRSIKDNFTLYNFAWNMQYIYSSVEIFYRNSKRVFLVEESANLAFIKPQPKWKVIFKRVLGFGADFYSNDKLISILVQNREGFPLDWGSKIITFNVKHIVSSLQESSKKEILYILLGNNVDKLLVEANSDYGIVFSQPFSEDSIISESQKIQDLKRIVHYYEKYGTPIIKIHPRDLSDYFFSDYIVLPGDFPSEVFLLLDVKFKYAVGVSSSAVLTANAEKKIVLNKNYALEKRFNMIPI